MAGLSTALEIGKQALFSQQTAVSVTGHNMANVNTAGFSRQRPTFIPAPSINFLGAWVGTGVTVAMIERIYDRFLAGQISAHVQGKGKAEAQNYILDQVESIFNEALGLGLNHALGDFWNAWHTLATNPSGAAERSALIAKTATLTQLFRDTDSRLATIHRDTNHAIRGTVEQINLLAHEIASLNHAIKQLEVGGQQPANDLRDRQQLLVDQLAELVSIQIYQQADSQLSLQLPGGKPLVNGSSVWQLATTQLDPSVQVQWMDSSGTQVNITAQLSQGKLGGLIETRDTLLVDYRGKLDTLAAALIKAVNSLHSRGIGLSPFASVTSTFAVSSTSAPLSSTTAGLPFGDDIVGGSFQVFVYDSAGAVIGSHSVTINAGTTSLEDVRGELSSISGIAASIDPTQGTLTIKGSSGQRFAFAGDTSNVLAALGLNTLFVGSGARDIAVNPLIQTNTHYLATAHLEPSGTYAVGDNRNALTIAAVQNTSMLVGGVSRTLDEFYGTLIGQIGTDSQQAGQQLLYQEVMLTQLVTRRDAISGVSLDEEMTNLIKFQQAYDAAAKLISRIDEMLRTIIEMV